MKMSFIIYTLHEIFNMVIKLRKIRPMKQVASTEEMESSYNILMIILKWRYYLET
jgi:hypothetical protein